MIFNNLRRFNNTLTRMIIQFNKYREAANDHKVIDNREGIFNPGNSGDTRVILSAIASVLYGHFDTNNVRSRGGMSCAV